MTHDYLCMSALLLRAHTSPHPLAGHVSNTHQSACFVLLKWQWFLFVEQLCSLCNSCCKDSRAPPVLM